MSTELIWLRATPASAPEGPQPIYLEVLAEAVLEVTGSTVSELLAKRGGEEPLNYQGLLGDATAAVRDQAASALDDGLRRLAHRPVARGESGRRHSWFHAGGRSRP